MQTNLLKIQILIIMIAVFTSCTSVSHKSGKPQKPTDATISLQEGKWHINGNITYPGMIAEGLLMNVRMVNSTFEDDNRPGFNSMKNTSDFIRRIPSYHAVGVRAFTLNLQGGMPGYEGAVNSAYNPDGSLKTDYMARVAGVIEACNQSGIAVILGCFYQRQDQVLQDEAAIKQAIRNTVQWINEQGFQNVVLEIANEFMHGGFDHELISDPERHVELIQLAKQEAPNLLVSTSGMGDGRMPDVIAREVDFILIHFNGTRIEDIPARITALKSYNKPIVCNEDDKVNEAAVDAMLASVRNGVSYGYMNSKVNQYEPFEFKGVLDDPVFYDRLRRITVGS